MATDSDSTWQSVEKLVRVYSYITVAAVLFGIVAAHLPFIIGHPWSSCKVAGCECGCVLAFHLYEVPLVSFNAYFAWYGLKRFSRQTPHGYNSMLIFAVIANLVFFTFEITLLQDSLRRQAPQWENIALTSIATILMGGSFFGMFVRQKLVHALHPTT